MKTILFTLFCSLATAVAFAQPGNITNIEISQRTDGSGFVDIYYDLSGGAGVYDISVEASFDGGSTFSPIPPAYLEGAVSGVSPGSGRHIVWDGMGSFPNTFSTRVQVRMLASGDDNGGTCPPTFTDHRDGQTYTAVQIGNQCWMAENLNYNSGYGSWCNDHNPINCINYGRLYSWHALMNGESSSSSNPSGVQGVCPDGWHVPSDAEWNELVNYVVSQGFPNSSSDQNGASNALKSCRQVDSPLGGDCDTSNHPRWNYFFSHNGFDEFGFSALPGGFEYSAWGFGMIGIYGFWWSATESSSTNPWYRRIDNHNGSVLRDKNYNKSGHLSLRCVRNITGEPTTYNLHIDLQPENSGSFSGAGNYTAGIQVNITATPNEGWIFTGWTGNSDYIDNPESANTFLTMPAYDISLMANFEYVGVCPPTITDSRDGQTYTVVQIGDQCWMAENLNYDPGSESWCHNNNISNCDNYGRLYTWHTVMNGESSSSENPSGVQGICPDGWHVPSDAEWTELVNYVISQGFPNNDIINGAGNALKSCRQVESPLGGDCDTSEHPRWNSHDTHYGFDEFGVSALPGGELWPDGLFRNLGERGLWWSSTKRTSPHAWVRFIYHRYGDVYRGFGNKTSGFSLRCIRELE